MQIVTPFEVKTDDSSGLDYNKLVEQFGSRLIDSDLMDKFEKVDGNLHHFIKRGIFYSHRDFDKILEAHKKGDPFYLYTGRGPSSASMHLGHLVPMMFCKYLQDTFKVPLVIQITDDEKMFFKDLPQAKIQPMAMENIKDIIACGFDPNLTFIFKNSEMMGQLYPMVMNIQHHINLRQVAAVFGFGLDNLSIGKLAFPSVQMAPSFASTFEGILTGNLRKMRCLVPCAIDQDPYFRMSRDIAGKLKHPKPALIHSKFIPSLSGVNEKMSASKPNTMIFLSDSPKQIAKKINKSFSGGGITLEEHQENGGNVEVDVPFQLLTVFLEDDELLENYRKGYTEGTITTGQMKKLAIETIQKIVVNFQNRRATITENLMKKFMEKRIIK